MSLRRVNLACLVVSVVMVGSTSCRDDHGTTPPPPVTPPPAPTARAAPSAKLAPDEVVRLVTEAMRHNDSPAADTGIATAFAFASPGNRQVTGPLARFVPMVKSPMYGPLLNYVKIEYAPVRVQGDYAEQLVKVSDEDGVPAQFLWILSRQTHGEFKGCWMTDGVTRLGAEPTPPDPQQREEQEAPQIRV
jgi:hypothetical protein